MVLSKKKPIQLEYRLLTLSRPGFFFILTSALLSYLYDPLLTSVSPAWLYFTHGLLLFLYQVYIGVYQVPRGHWSAPGVYWSLSGLYWDLAGLYWGIGVFCRCLARGTSAITCRQSDNILLIYADRDSQTFDAVDGKQARRQVLY